MLLAWQQQQEVVRLWAAVQCWNGAKSRMEQKKKRRKEMREQEPHETSQSQNVYYEQYLKRIKEFDGFIIKIF